jgi:hypothetical protein
VWTANTQTEAWFAEFLSIETDLESEQQLDTRQSRTGLLARVSIPIAHSDCAPNVTEVLFYGILETAEDNQNPQFHVYALPLSSHRLNALPTTSTPPLSPDLPSAGIESRFLPSIQSDATQSANPLSDVFTEAKELRRKVKGGGGESVAAAAAGIPKVTLLQGQKKRKQPSVLEDSKTKSSASRSLTRTSSLPFDFCLPSRKDSTDLSSKRSDLSRAASFAVGDGDVGVEQRNKDAISRLIMAGMRIHGLQPRKKAQQALNIDGSNASEQGRAFHDPSAEDEYKLIYHQTYKGAVFAFVSPQALPPGIVPY